jgi:hypothetical protein
MKLLLSFIWLFLLILFDRCCEPKTITKIITDTIYVKKTDTFLLNKTDTLFISSIDTVFLDDIDTFYFEKTVYKFDTFFVYIDTACYSCIRDSVNKAVLIKL